MGGRGGLGELVVGLVVAADDRVASGRVEAAEADQVVDIALDRDEAAAAYAGLAVGDDGGVDGGLVPGVLGAVLVAGQVATAAVAEGVDLFQQAPAVAELAVQFHGAVEHRPALVAADEQPQGALRGGERDAHAAEGREAAQAGDLGREREHQRGAEADQRLVLADLGDLASERHEAGAGITAGVDVENEDGADLRRRPEDGGLGTGWTGWTGRCARGHSRPRP